MSAVQDPGEDLQAVLERLREHLGDDLSSVSDEQVRQIAGVIGEGTVRIGSDGRQVRWQDGVILDAIPAGSSVLDLGCGNGHLLRSLCGHKQVRGQGVELGLDAVSACIQAGVPVLQADIDAGLKGFADDSFDIVVLEETLQTLHRPVEVLRELLRVGRLGIVSFPNFGHWRVRINLLLNGRMPTTRRLPYHWHDTPNIHLLTIADFIDWTEKEGILIERCMVFSDGEVRPYRDRDNLDAGEALFFIKRPES